MNGPYFQSWFLVWMAVVVIVGIMVGGWEGW